MTHDNTADRQAPAFPVLFAGRPAGQSRAVRVHHTPNESTVWLDLAPVTWQQLPEGWAASYDGATRPDAHLDLLQVGHFLFVTATGRYIDAPLVEYAAAKHLGHSRWAVPRRPFMPPVVGVPK